MGTTGYSDGVGERLAWEELFECGGVRDFCCFGGFGICGCFLRKFSELELGGTAEGPDAAEVGVALGDDVGDLETLQ